MLQREQVKEDRIAAILEKLAGAQPELTAELVELMARADASTLLKLFGSKHVETVPADNAHPAAAAVLPTQPPPPREPERRHDERGFLLPEYRTPDRFPRPISDAGTTGWSA
jgi:hypothetical protein